MDPLTRFVLGPRSAPPTCLRVGLAGTWGMDVQDRSSLTVLVVTRGSLVVEASGEAHPVTAGQAAVVRGPDDFRVASREGAPSRIRIGEGQSCETLDGEPLHLAWRRGVRSWGMPGPSDTEFLIAVHTDATASSRAIGAVLPRVLVGEPSAPAVDLLAAELAGGGVGQEGLLASLAAVVLVQAVRDWAERHPGECRWLAAPGDAVVGPMLAAIHASPAEPHTVASLAAASNVSRAAASARFTAVVGTPVGAYLRSWRLALAADLIAERRLPLDAVAARVGYGSGFALSAAFSREFGVSPAEHRARSA